MSPFIRMLGAPLADGPVEISAGTELNSQWCTATTAELGVFIISIPWYRAQSSLNDKFYSWAKLYPQQCILNKQEKQGFFALTCLHRAGCWCGGAWDGDLKRTQEATDGQPHLLVVLREVLQERGKSCSGTWIPWSGAKMCSVLLQTVFSSSSLPPIHLLTPFQRNKGTQALCSSYQWVSKHTKSISFQALLNYSKKTHLEISIHTLSQSLLLVLMPWQCLNSPQHLNLRFITSRWFFFLKISLAIKFNLFTASQITV